MRVVFVGRDRKAWAVALASAATLGIWRRVWLYRILREIDGHAALGMRHGLAAAMLAAPAAGIVAAILMATAGVPFTPWPAVLIALSFVPSGIVAFQAVHHTARMLAGSPVPYGPPWAVWLATVVPFVGSILFFIPWQQTRLNRYWAHERGQTGHGVEVDVDLASDPRFLVELGQALRASYHAGSRLDTKRRERRQRWEARWSSWQTVQTRRQAIRAAGGTTPVLPWRMPRPPPVRLLHVTCGQCSTAFDVTRDPLVDTPLVCPRCGQADVLPSLHSDPLKGKEVAGVPELKVTCPRCQTVFHCVRNLHGPTQIRCPECGHQDTLEAPQARRKAERPVTTRA